MENTEVIDTQAVPTPTVPEELDNNVKALRALATINSLLLKGYFPTGCDKAINECLEFVRIIHGNLMSDSLKHPSAHLIPQLKEELEKQKEPSEQTKN